MKDYLSQISFNKNSRGVFCLDTSVGCYSGFRNNKNGCYNDCYAGNIAKRYGYDFSKTTLRYFTNRKHELETINKINNSKTDFIRIGSSGDPSENWEHTVSILKIISKAEKEIVIITKHWNNLTSKHLEFLNTINVCINTSVSALDKPKQLENRLRQYERIKKYCKSVLRIVSANFNLENKHGVKFFNIQSNLFKNENTLDTVLRINKNNPYVINKIINVKRDNFLHNKVLMSRYNTQTYLGDCLNCMEKCGINNSDFNYKRFIPRQLFLFA